MILYKKDFKPLISDLKKSIKKAERSKKESLDKKHRGEYPLDFQISDSENEGKIIAYRKVLKALEHLLKKK